MKKQIALCVLVSLPFIVTAKDTQKKDLETTPENIIQKKVELPMDGLTVVETKNGKTLFISKNGRYTFEGKLRNVYTQKEIKSLKDAEDERYFKIQDLDLSDSDIAPIPFGNPDLPLQARIFIDPYCKTCSALLDKLKELKKEIRVEILITPVSDKKAIKRGLALWCRYEADTSTANQVLEDLANPPKEEPKTTPAPSKDCHGNRVLLNSMLTRVLATPGLPLFWRADGATFAGIPKDIKKFLNDKRETKS